jgi:hypothetical protein
MYVAFDKHTGLRDIVAIQPKDASSSSSRIDGRERFELSERFFEVTQRLLGL